ncbi:MAG: hypothetical protein IJ565_04700 [Bacilli bacterium]|nr:hypothetical protein [Bacilli bacterium]
MKTIKEVIDNYKYQNESFSTGFASIDKGYKIRTSEVTVIAARPAMGKDMLAINIISNNVNKDVSGAIIADDNYTLRNLIAINSDYGLFDLYDKDLKSDVDIVHVLEKLKNKNIYIENVYTDDVTININNIKKLKDKDKNLKVVLVEHALDSDVAKYKTLARELDIAIILLFTLPRTLEDRNDKMPRLSDLPNEVVRNADNVLLLYRENYYKRRYELDGKSLIEIYLAKATTESYRILFLLYNARTRKVENIEDSELEKYQNKFTKVLNENIKEEDIKVQYWDYNDNYYTLLNDGSFYSNDELYAENIDAIWYDEPNFYVAIISKDNKVMCVNNDTLSKYINNGNKPYRYILASSNYLACITDDNKLKLITNGEGSFGVDADCFNDVEDVFVKEIIEPNENNVIGETLYVVKDGIEKQVFVTDIGDELICEKR